MAVAAAREHRGDGGLESLKIGRAILAGRLLAGEGRLGEFGQLGVEAGAVFQIFGAAAVSPPVEPSGK